MERASKQKEKAWNNLTLFALSVGIVDLCSRIMLNLEQNGKANSLLYLTLTLIIAFFLVMGVSSLYDLYKIVEWCDVKTK